MAQFLSNVLVHLVFSTKDRRSLIQDAEREELHRYFTGILRQQDSPLLEINSVADQIHILFSASKNQALAGLVENVKTHSSKWIKSLDTAYSDFYWQRGYGAFSVSPTQAARVRLYIREQAEHHAKTSFQTEFRRLCSKNHVPLDERYVWE